VYAYFLFSIKLLKKTVMLLFTNTLGCSSQDTHMQGRKLRPRSGSKIANALLLLFICKRTPLVPRAYLQINPIGISALNKKHNAMSSLTMI
jgi:hypothetical protein